MPLVKLVNNVPYSPLEVKLARQRNIPWNTDFLKVGA